MTPTTALPAAFRRVQLELAREPGRPLGDPSHGFVFIAPLDEDGALVPELWKSWRQACRVVRFHPDGEEHVGHLVRLPGGSWSFRYDVRGEDDGDPARRFGDARFVPGAYVSIEEDDGLHTFKVVSIQPVARVAAG